jgi:hypothetical protein
VLPALHKAAAKLADGYHRFEDTVHWVLHVVEVTHLFHAGHHLLFA